MRLMQQRFLEYFVALAREKHFARAAASCNVTQPTLSAGIAQLERLLGGRRLVVRDRRFVGLTVEGAAILPWAQTIVAAHDGLVSELAARVGPLAGALRLGVIPAAAPVVGELVRVVHDEHPTVDFAIRSMTSQQIEAGLRSHEIDAGLTYLDNEPLTEVRTVPVYLERYLFATHADGSLAHATTVQWEAAAQLPLCLLHPGMQNRRILDAHLASLNLSVTPVAVADSYVALIAMVALGGLSTILPDSYRRFIAPETAVRLLEFEAPHRINSVGLVVRDEEPLAPLTRAAVAAARVLAERANEPAL